MAKRGTNKRRSVDQENYIASLYDGVVSPSSGAANNDSGDVRTRYDLIECKTTGGPGEKFKSPLSKKIRDEFIKVTQEAYAEGKEPVLALRWFDPDSLLADSQGWVDLVIRRVGEDSFRSAVVHRLKDDNDGN
jgi:hypothetical protein